MGTVIGLLIAMAVLVIMIIGLLNRVSRLEKFVDILLDSELVHHKYYKKKFEYIDTKIQKLKENRV